MKFKIKKLHFVEKICYSLRSVLFNSNSGVFLGGFLMSDKITNDRTPKDEQPWNRQFGEEDSLNERPYSRSARNSKGKTSISLANVLLLIFFMVLSIPTVYMMWFYQKTSQAQVKPRTADEVMLTKAVETTTVEATTTSQPEETTSSTTSAPTTTTQTETVRPQRPEVTTVEASGGQQNGNYGIYVVQAGETLYRIAVNHNMDVETLKSINGLTSNNISPGMQLKVLQ